MELGRFVEGEKCRRTWRGYFALGRFGRDQASVNPMRLGHREIVTAIFEGQSRSVIHRLLILLPYYYYYHHHYRVFVGLL